MDYMFKVGKLKINGGYMSVIDPGYDSDTSGWLVRNIPIKEGIYDLFIEEYDNPDYQVVTSAEIRISGLKVTEDDWEEIGEMSVDSGMASFFQNKPDFDDITWGKIVSAMFSDEAMDELVKSKDYPDVYTYVDEDNDIAGFIVPAGLGDGMYPVYGVKKGKKYVALAVQFMD